MFNREPISPDQKLRRLSKELFRAIALRCHGKTLVLDRGESHLVKMIKGQQLDVTEIDISKSEIPKSYSEGSNINITQSSTDSLTLPEEGFNTVVLAEVHQIVPEDTRALILSKAWRLLRPAGRLIVTVPNQEYLPRRHRVEQLKRRNLKRLLKPFGIPKLVKEQPFKWLLMYVTKGKSNSPLLSHSNRVRFRVTAQHCYGKVIELGCGEGHLTKVISVRGLEVIGVDISATKIRRASELYPKITFIQCDICELTLPEESFDTVILAEVLEHVPEDKGAQMLSKAWQLLRPVGRLIVSVPNEDCILHPHHIRQFSLRSLKRLLQPLGKPKVVTDQPYKWLMMYVDRTSV